LFFWIIRKLNLRRFFYPPAAVVASVLGQMQRSWFNARSLVSPFIGAKKLT